MNKENIQSKFMGSLSNFCLKKTSLIIIGLIIGIFFGWSVRGILLNHELDQSLNLRESGYEYISPLLDVEPRSMINRSDLIILENGLQELITEILHKNEGHISHVSIYYKEFSSGAWIGINEKENFSPASLLKVPLMMAYFKIADTNKNYLEKKIQYQPIEVEVSQNITPTNSLIKGELYSIEELINKMIVDSDNQAFFTLYKYMKQQDQKKTYLDLGLKFPDENEPEDFMNVKDYAGFFRILYNASYLSKEMSSKALKLLTKVTFDKGIIAGVSNNIKVAHKFGERGYAMNSIKQLHDCGIVYHPKKPFLLCVMTRGDKIENLEDVIQEISKYTYRAIDK